jgi:hypothetical protein
MKKPAKVITSQLCHLGSTPVESDGWKCAENIVGIRDVADLNTKLGDLGPLRLHPEIAHRLDEFVLGFLVVIARDTDHIHTRADGARNLASTPNAGECLLGQQHH